MIKSNENKKLAAPVLTARQKEALQILLSQEYTDILFDGGSRAGKTFLVCLFLILISPIFPVRSLIAREKYNHVILSVWLQTLMPMLKQYFYGHYEIDESHKIVRFPSGAEIWMGGLDDKERTDKIFGQEYGIIFLNEAVQISPSTRQKIATRLAQKVEGFKNMMIYDCNPRSPAHDLYRLFYLLKPPGSIQLKWTPFDNKENLSKDYFARLEQLSETSRRRYLLGEWCELEGSVYTNIKSENVINVSKNFAKYDSIVGGIDFGYNAHVSIWGIKEKQAYCMYGKEIVGGRTSQIKNYLNEISWLKNQVTFYCDHENDRIDELADAGYIVKQAYKEVGAGDGTVNEYELYFDTEAVDTFQSMLNLMREQDKDGKYLDKHIKVNDHGADCSRYALHGYKMDNSGNGEHYFVRGLT